MISLTEPDPDVELALLLLLDFVVAPPDWELEELLPPADPELAEPDDPPDAEPSAFVVAFLSAFLAALLSFEDFDVEGVIVRAADAVGAEEALAEAAVVWPEARPDVAVPPTSPTSAST